jgi:hypothetical protein
LHLGFDVRFFQQLYRWRICIEIEQSHHGSGFAAGALLDLQTQLFSGDFR